MYNRLSQLLRIFWKSNSQGLIVNCLKDNLHRVQYALVCHAFDR